MQTEARSSDVRTIAKEEIVQSKLIYNRCFTDSSDGDVFDSVEWETRDAVIKNTEGTVVFEQLGVEFPKTWSQLATNITVEKYFRGKLGTEERETSLKQVIARVVGTIVMWGRDQHYFDDPTGTVFHDELVHILLHQRAAFNSPVWFNLGIERDPQVSACFIQSVDDSMESIMELAKSEAMLFKYGSGTGSNLSALRSSKEHLAGGGKSSGPVSFMRGFDSFAGAIKSGGKTRRAAKMVILDVSHPDILEFINCKVDEEKKARALIDSGWDGAFNTPNGAYASVQFQNANNSVRVSDTFMKAVEDDLDWYTSFVTTKERCETLRAREVFNTLAQAAWECGDPGIQFDTTINAWNTCENSGRINSSNPCSEYMHLDDTACNLASINLRKFEGTNGTGWFDVDSFTHTVETLITAQDIMINRAFYPTKKIGKGAKKYRQLGLGYANLGALLMSKGIPYDSDEGRQIASAITDLLQATSYMQSAGLAQLLGPFEAYKKNAEPMCRVVQKHVDAHDSLRTSYTADVQPIVDTASNTWGLVRRMGDEWGFRNAQVSVLAPTGTIGFLMDCDTTGIEPELALVKYKNLVGGGQLKIVNNVVGDALSALEYEPKVAEKIKEFVHEHGTVEGCKQLQKQHLPVFDCSFRSVHGSRKILPLGHLKMMAAAQPFLSGAISKTVNVDSDTTPEGIGKLLMESWKLGLKSVAVYRDGCKRTQPLSTSADTTTKERKFGRKRLQDERQALCHKFAIAGNHEGYLHVGLYEDGTPGELFITMAKEGSTISGIMDGFAQAVSIGLQHGVPLHTYIDKFSHMRFEPSGMTANPQIRMAKSILDYIFRWMGMKFDNKPVSSEEPVVTESVDSDAKVVQPESDSAVFVNEMDAPICHNCGNITVRNGSCHKCLECGESLGCS